MRAVAVREDIEDLILDAADRLLARYGYRKMTMDDLAQEVGIGKGTLYLHFRSKEDIALSRVDRLVRRIVERLREIASGDDAPPRKLKEMLLLRVMFRFDAVQHYTESLSEVLRDIRPRLLERHAQHFEAEAEVFARVLKEGQRSGLFRRLDAVQTAHAMLAATNSLLPFSLSVSELGKRREVQETTTRIADLLLQGVQKT
ncbi:MAG TPA: helix-turn-helix domain-containing protein [Pyrinomonadaceae bacterium]|nr:helix-turn-helix domain-containing protein [Pyrinomonadaceae bacterium]